jgi:hypothetical protein
MRCRCEANPVALAGTIRPFLRIISRAVFGYSVVTFS